MLGNIADGIRNMMKFNELTSYSSLPINHLKYDGVFKDVFADNTINIITLLKFLGLDHHESKLYDKYQENIKSTLESKLKLMEVLS